MDNESIKFHPGQQIVAIPASPGIAHGISFCWQTATIASTYIANPQQAVTNAFQLVTERLDNEIVRAEEPLATLLQATKLMLHDDELKDGIAQQLNTDISPAIAIKNVTNSLAETLEELDNEYFRDRAIDVRALGTMLVAALTNSPARQIPKNAVIIARELAPLDTAQLAELGVAALITVRGGPTCHAAIIARSWGIPAVVGAPESLLELPDGALLQVDGERGTVTINPTATVAYTKSSEQKIKLSRRVPIYANIGSLAEAERAMAAGADGIGLLRTEFLFQQRPTPPDEAEQYTEYCAIAKVLTGKPLIVRTLDIGADKPVAFLPKQEEANPQMGLRGIRLCLQQRELITTQLRALLRCAAQYPLKIMLPMVTMLEEVRETRNILQELAKEMKLPIPPLGIMIEVPMAALAAEELAQQADFFSIGSNDLLQFLLAADRELASIAYLQQSEHQGAWRLLKIVSEATKAAQIPLGICGEWAADPKKLPRLLELEINSISVACGAIERVRGLMPDE